MIKGKGQNNVSCLEALWVQNRVGPYGRLASTGYSIHAYGQPLRGVIRGLAWLRL